MSKRGSRILKCIYVIPFLLSERQRGRGRYSMPSSQLPNSTRESICVTDNEMSWTEEQVNIRDGLKEGNYHFESDLKKSFRESYKPLHSYKSRKENQEQNAVFHFHHTRFSYHLIG